MKYRKQKDEWMTLPNENKNMQKALKYRSAGVHTDLYKKYLQLQEDLNILPVNWRSKSFC